jgi:hypothetical protein
MPHSDAQEGPLSEITASGRALTDTFASGMDEEALRGKADLAFQAAMPGGESAVDFHPSGRALIDTFTSGIDDEALRGRAELPFQAVMPRKETAINFPEQERKEGQRQAPVNVNIQRLYVQAEDCETLFDFMRMIMQAGFRPQEAPV